MSKNIMCTSPEVSYDDVIMFGKYRGLTWLDILAINPEYILWCCGSLKSISFSKDMLVAACLSKYARS